MLTIIVPEREMYNEKKNEFSYLPETKLVLEHSLVSLSKWESKWKKSWLSSKDKTNEEVLDYIRCMTITQNVNPAVYYALTEKNISDITDYISDSMTATTIREDPRRKASHQILTSELIYYLMISYGIPDRFEKWHLNRLLTLISICDIKSGPKPKMSRKEIAEFNRALNDERRAKYKTNG